MSASLSGQAPGRGCRTIGGMPWHGPDGQRLYYEDTGRGDTWCSCQAGRLAVLWSVGDLTAKGVLLRHIGTAAEPVSARAPR
jgi:hypothetical protein